MEYGQMFERINYGHISPRGFGEEHPAHVSTSNKSLLKPSLRSRPPLSDAQVFAERGRGKSVLRLALPLKVKKQVAHECCTDGCSLKPVAGTPGSGTVTDGGARSTLVGGEMSKDQLPP